MQNQISPEYAAGFFDGEGCVHISVTYRTTHAPNKRRKIERKPRTRLSRGVAHYEWVSRATISNTNQKILEFFKSYWGGTINCNHQTSGRPNSKPVFWWGVASKKGEIFLRDIYPFLVVKKKHAEAYFAFRETIGKPGSRLTDELIDRRIEIIDTLRHLSARGAIPKTIRPLILPDKHDADSQWIKPHECKSVGCSNTVRSSGLCNRHYLNIYRKERYRSKGTRALKNSL